MLSLQLLLSRLVMLKHHILHLMEVLQDPLELLQPGACVGKHNDQPLRLGPQHSHVEAHCACRHLLHDTNSVARALLEYSHAVDGTAATTSHRHTSLMITASTSSAATNCSCMLPQSLVLLRASPQPWITTNDSCTTAWAATAAAATSRQMSTACGRMARSGFLGMSGWVSEPHNCAVSEFCRCRTMRLLACAVKCAFPRVACTPCHLLTLA